MILANALAIIYMSSFATNFVNWFKEVPGKISNFYQGTKEKVKALRTHSKAEQPRFSSIHRSLYPVMSGDGLHAKRPLPVCYKKIHRQRRFLRL